VLERDALKRAPTRLQLTFVAPRTL
jgi:hypothetical protein